MHQKICNDVHQGFIIPFRFRVSPSRFFCEIEALYRCLGLNFRKSENGRDVTIRRFTPYGASTNSVFRMTQLVSNIFMDFKRRGLDVWVGGWRDGLQGTKKLFETAFLLHDDAC